MDVSFKVPLQKAWSMQEDRIIYGAGEIMFSEITDVKLSAKGTIGTNGCIHIYLENKVVNLIYPSKLRDAGYEAFLYLEEKLSKDNGISRNKTQVGVRKEIDSLPFKNEWGTKKEIGELPKVLSFDEVVKAITSGLTDGNTWLIVCTNKRVLMMDKGMVYGLRLIDIPLDRINSISHSKGLLLGKIAITDGSTTRTIENVSNTTVSYFADTVNKEVENYKQSKNSTGTQVVNKTSAADELLKYKQLLDMGVLTQDEFDVKKKELLGL